MRNTNSKFSSIKIESDYNFEEFKKFVQNRILPLTTTAANTGHFDREIYESLHQMGLLQSATPKDFGGRGLNVTDLIWLVRELAYGSAGIAGTFIGNLLGYSTILIYANDELKKILIDKTISHLNLWSFAMTEAGVGSDLQNTQTIATETSDGYIISGEKNFITNAPIADDLSVFAQTYDSFGNKRGVSCFYIPGNSKGLKRGATMDKIGWRESQTGTLYFYNVCIPKNFLLGEIGQGLSILTHCLNRSKTLLGAMAVGVSYRAMDLAIERLAATERYGKPLLEQSSIRHLFARLHTEVEAAWLLTCSAATTWDHQKIAVREASMAKLYAGQVASKVTSQMMELFGARGYFNDFEISKLWRDAKAIEIVEGPSLVQELLIAKEILPKNKTKQTSKEDVFQVKSDELSNFKDLTFAGSPILGRPF